jgi:uncharacterized protein (DUF342 family)
MENNKNYKIDVTLSNDYYAAYLTLHLLEKEATLTLSDLKEALAKKNVVFGIKESVLQQLADNPRNVDTQLVAEGIPHENGTNAEITFLIDYQHEVKPKLEEDGSVNFKDMNYIETVKRGAILATKTQPTEGKDGTTVTGKKIHGKMGKDAPFKIGKNVSVSRDGSAILADTEGVVKMDDGRVSVLSILEIDSDVGLGTGNIDFNGEVRVKGNVISDFEIKAKDQLIINGLVESARLTSGGDLIINGGIQGNDRAVITTDGNLISKYIINAKVIVKGNIEADTIMHSEVICDGQVILKGRKGSLVGGITNVKEAIDARIIGSEMGTQTRIRLGIDQEMILEFQRVSEEMKQVKENLTKLQQASSLLEKKLRAQPDDAKTSALLKNTRDNIERYRANLQELADKNETISEKFKTARDAKIDVGTLYPGVKIQISSDYMNVKDTFKNVTIKRSQKGIDIISK